MTQKLLIDSLFLAPPSMQCNFIILSHKLKFLLYLPVSSLLSASEISNPSYVSLYTPPSMHPAFGFFAKLSTINILKIGHIWIQWQNCFKSNILSKSPWRLSPVWKSTHNSVVLQFPCHRVQERSHDGNPVHGTLYKVKCVKTLTA